MSEATHPTGGLTRRGFLKTTGAAAAGLACAGAVGAAIGGGMLAPAKATAQGEERTAHLCHQFHCLTGCNLKCTIRDERITLIEPSDIVADKKHSTICLRGIGELSHIYAQDRLKVPLKRVGERGAGEFEQISWDEAIKTIADNLKEAQQKYGEGSVFIRKSTEAGIEFDFITQLLHADSGGNWGLDRGQANGLGPAFGPWSYLSNRSHWEFKDAATIIELSHNPLESAMVWSRPLMDAKEAGTYIVTIDPRFTGTAAKSDEWLPVRPGTDAALIQGMLKAVVDNEWYDEAFVLAHTSCPYLVDRDTGKSYRSAEVMAPNPAVVSAEPVGAPMVWDTVTGAPVLYDSANAIPALEGEWTVDGKHLVTEFTLIKEWLDTLTLEWAAETSGIDQQTIVNLADRYANNGPAIIDIGLGGADKYTNADVLGHSTAMLVALTGQYGKKGAGYGSYCGLGANDPSATFNYWALPEEYHYGDSPVYVRHALSGEQHPCGPDLRRCLHLGGGRGQ